MSIGRQNCMIRPLISIIIPALDEEIALPATLADAADQDGQHEIIVVDGGSRDRTREVVEAAAVDRPQIRLATAKRGSAPQMNAGADTV